MQWSVEEQTIPLTTDHPHITGIRLRTDTNNSHVCAMELLCAPTDDDPPVVGYAISFARNGMFISAAPMTAPAVPPTDVAPPHPTQPPAKPTSSKK